MHYHNCICKINATIELFSSHLINVARGSSLAEKNWSIWQFLLARPESKRLIGEGKVQAQSRAKKQSSLKLRSLLWSNDHAKNLDSRTRETRKTAPCPFTKKNERPRAALSILDQTIHAHSSDSSAISEKFFDESADLAE